MLKELRDTDGKPHYVDLKAITSITSSGEMVTINTGATSITFRACYADEMPRYLNKLSNAVNVEAASNGRRA